MSAETELRGCPFCGGEAWSSYVTGMVSLWRVGCRQCGANVEFGCDPFDKVAKEAARQKAEAAWNTRAPGSAMGEVATKQTALDEFLREHFQNPLEASFGFKCGWEAALAHPASAAEGWRPIEEACIDAQIVAAYFGANKGLFGAAAVGRFFRWERMKERLLTGWPFAEPPTHFIPLPAPPALSTDVAHAKGTDQDKL